MSFTLEQVKMFTRPSARDSYHGELEVTHLLIGFCLKEKQNHLGQKMFL